MNWKQVDKVAFHAWLAAYPRKLVSDIAGMYEPPLLTYNDFALAPMWPESIVAKVILRDSADGSVRADGSARPNEYFVSDVSAVSEERGQLERRKDCDPSALRVHARVCAGRTEWEDVASKFMLMAANDIERLREMQSNSMAMLDKAATECVRLKDEIERLHAARGHLLAALEWYADKENYVTSQDCPDALIDGGSLARRALEQSISQKSP